MPPKGRRIVDKKERKGYERTRREVWNRKESKGRTCKKGHEKERQGRVGKETQENDRKNWEEKGV